MCGFLVINLFRRCRHGAAAVFAATLAMVTGCDTNEYEPTNVEPSISGRGSFVLERLDVSPRVRVFYYVPESATPTSRVLFVLHGSGRDAENLRDVWIAAADARDLVVFAPLFSNGEFPGGSGYILGNVFDNGNRPGGEPPKPQQEWAFSVLEPLFDEVKARAGNTSTRYDVFGHSGGAQFAHRFVLFFPDGRYDRVMAANPGWYTVPDPTIGFPYGTAGSPIEATGAAYFARSLTILAGDQDTDPDSPGLRHTDEADAQGLHRFERALHFYDESRRLVGSGTFAWDLVVVPGVGHNGAAMGARAAELLYPMQ